MLDERLQGQMLTEHSKKVVGNFLIKSWHDGKMVSCFCHSHSSTSLWKISYYSIHDITLQRTVILFTLHGILSTQRITAITII